MVRNMRAAAVTMHPNMRDVETEKPAMYRGAELDGQMYDPLGGC